AETVLGEMGRARMVRWAGVLVIALLGAVGVGLVLYARSTPQLTEKAEPRGPVSVENVRVFDSRIPLLVRELGTSVDQERELAKPPRADRRGTRIPGGARWYVMPPPVGTIPTGNNDGLMYLEGPRLTGQALHEFVAEVRRQEVPGVSIRDQSFTDDDLA